MNEDLQQRSAGGVTPVDRQSGAALARAVERVIEDMGGTALVGPARENLCRRASLAELAQFDGRAWIIESQGLPNLIHELVHALFLGYLDDDHGFDYGEIPLDAERSGHRAWLWEEMACCALSTTTCAPFHPDPAAFSRAWFAEQFEIQGVFHGLEHDLDGFRRHIDRQLADPERLDEFERAIARGHALLAACLPEVELPSCDGLALWRDYLNNCARPKPDEDASGRIRVK